MNKENNKIYIIGYGNRFRQDDALGHEMIEMLRADSINGVILENKCQLSVDDAYDISESDSSVVFFVDASLQGDEPFSFYPVEPGGAVNFSIPLMTPESILSMCGFFFNKNVKGYVIGIKGYEWDFSADMSSDARLNLIKAYSFLQDTINDIKNNFYSCNAVPV